MDRRPQSVQYRGKAEKWYDDTSAPHDGIVIRIIRSNGIGLGISIAGGTGSVPYVEDDEVCSFSNLVRTSACISVWLFASRYVCFVLMLVGSSESESCSIDCRLFVDCAWYFEILAPSSASSMSGFLVVTRKCDFCRLALDQQIFFCPFVYAGYLHIESQPSGRCGEGRCVNWRQAYLCEGSYFDFVY